MMSRYAHAYVEVSVSLAWANGGRTFSIPVADMEFAKADPLACAAKHHRFKVEDYLRYMRDECSVRCSALTKKARQCRHIVAGGTCVDLDEYVEMQGRYCEVHENGA